MRPAHLPTAALSGNQPFCLRPARLPTAALSGNQPFCMRPAHLPTAALSGNQPFCLRPARLPTAALSGNQPFCMRPAHLPTACCPAATGYSALLRLATAAPKQIIFEQLFTGYSALRKMLICIQCVYLGQFYSIHDILRYMNKNVKDVSKIIQNTIKRRNR